MTTIFKASGTITNPPQGSFVHPDLGVSGVVTQYSARDLIGADGTAVTQLRDLVGGHDLNLTAGAAAIEDGHGPRLLDLYDGVNTVTMASDTFAGVGMDRTLVLSGYFTGNPTATEYVLATLANGASISMQSNGAFRAFGNGAGSLGSAVVGKPTAAVVVASLNDDLTAKIAVNGVIVSGAITYGATSTLSQMRLFSTVAMRLKVADVALIDHAVSDVEIAAITEALMGFLP